MDNAGFNHRKLKQQKREQLAKQADSRTFSNADTDKPMENSADSTVSDIAQEASAEIFPTKQPPKAPLLTEEGKIPEDKLPTLGKFVLLAEISRSPNGVVYKARQNDFTQRTIALNIVSGDANNPLDNSLKRFQQEIRHISKLSHPNIVPVYEVGNIDDWLYFTMAFVDGDSLDKLIKNKPLSGLEATKIISKVAKAINYAHKHGIIHRDIKPSNILLDNETGEPMIVDFGLAKDVKSDVQITQSGVTMGTPPYMPPEQARGLRDKLDSRSDVYSLGATLYELVTGRPPFHGETGIATLVDVINKTALRPRKLNPAISPDLEAIILKCLNKKQSERYQNALQLAEDLKRYQMGEWVSARQSTPFNRFLNFAYKYRYFVYSTLLVLFLLSIVLITSYFKKQFAQLDVIQPVRMGGENPEGTAFRDFKVLASDNEQRSADNLWLGRELWLSKDNPHFAKSFNTRYYAGIILRHPVQTTDFRLEFRLKLLPCADEQFPNISFFLIQNSKIPEIRPQFDPIMKKGYLITFGANDNTGITLYREGFAEISEPSFSLNFTEYKIKIEISSGKFFIEVQDEYRHIFNMEYTDDFPLPLEKGGFFGFVSVNTPAVISDLKLSVISPAVHPLDSANRLFNLGLYAEALIDYQQKALYAKARNNDELLFVSQFKTLKCEYKLNEKSPAEIINRLEKLRASAMQFAPFAYNRFLLELYFKAGDFKSFTRLFNRLVNDGNATQNEVLQIANMGAKYADFAMFCALMGRHFDLNPLSANFLKIDTDSILEFIKLGSKFSEAAELTALKNINQKNNTLFELAKSIWTIILNSSITDFSLLHRAKYFLLLNKAKEKLAKIKNNAKDEQSKIYEQLLAGFQTICKEGHKKQQNVILNRYLSLFTLLQHLKLVKKDKVYKTAIDYIAKSDVESYRAKFWRKSLFTLLNIGKH